MSCANLSALAKMSNKYGSDSNFVLAGGGNTSFKDEKYLYIKGSGSPLATIQPDDFVVMDRAALATIWSKQYSDNTAVREAEVLADTHHTLQSLRAPECCRRVFLTAPG